MKTTVNSYDFVQAFDDYDRSTKFSRAARFALFDYLEELEEAMEEEMELDVIGLCGEYTEYTSLEECLDDLGYTEEDYPDLDSLRDVTTVIEFDEGFLIRQF